MVKGLLLRIALYSVCIFAGFLVSFELKGMELDVRKILIHALISITAGVVIGMLKLAKRIGNG